MERNFERQKNYFKYRMKYLFNTVLILTVRKRKIIVGLGVFVPKDSGIVMQIWHVDVKKDVV